MARPSSSGSPTAGSTARSAATTGSAEPPTPEGARPLPRAFFERDTLEVARELLGKLLVRTLPDGEVRWGRLVEVEAYLGPDDLAAHSSRGLTPRTRVMFGPPGHAYVYFIYGMHHCLNFVTRPEGQPQAVLVRALDPGPGTPGASGPGLVCRALAIDRALNGVPLEPPVLYVADDGFQPTPAEVFTTPRIGVGYAGDWADRPWRFCLDSPYLSKRLKKTSVEPRRAASPPSTKRNPKPRA